MGESPVCDDGWGQEEARVTCRYHEHFPNTQKIHIIILSMLLFFHQPCQKDAGIFCWNSRGLVILRNCRDRRAVLEVNIDMSLLALQEIVMLQHISDNEFQRQCVTPITQDHYCSINATQTFTIPCHRMKFHCKVV